jgi:peptidoglycan DL-endopeptidase CwlO
MCACWRHWAVAGCERLAVVGVAGVVGVMGVVGVLGTVGAAAMASDGAAKQATVRPKSAVPKSAVPKSAATPRAGQLSSAQSLVAGRSAALARSTANTATLTVALSGLRTQGEMLTERYDREVSLEQQAAVAYQVVLTRLAAAREHEQRAVALLGQQAAADYESNGGQSMAVVFAGLTDPQGYLATLGLQQTLDNQRVDLLAASKADEIVTRLFSAQAASLLGQQRSAAQAAGFLEAAVIAAVNRQAAVVKAAKASRSLLAAETAAAQASEAALGAQTGAAPGVVAPDWASDAGASAAQGNIAASWALSQLGKPYQWGAAGPNSYDCSGLALEAWARAGVRLLHWTGFQWVSGPHVPLAGLRRGDLVFFATNIADPATIHHVGIYIGNGLMVDAPYTGAVVRIDSIYAVGGLIGATRPAA